MPPATEDRKDAFLDCCVLEPTFLNIYFTTKDTKSTKKELKIIRKTYFLIFVLSVVDLSENFCMGT